MYRKFLILLAFSLVAPQPEAVGQDIFKPSNSLTDLFNPVAWVKSANRRAKAKKKTKKKQRAWLEFVLPQILPLKEDINDYERCYESGCEPSDELARLINMFHNSRYIGPGTDRRYCSAYFLRSPDEYCTQPPREGISQAHWDYLYDYTTRQYNSRIKALPRDLVRAIRYVEVTLRISRLEKDETVEPTDVLRFGDWIELQWVKSALKKSKKLYKKLLKPKVL